MDKLFESLYTKSYLPSAEPTKAEAKPAGQEKEEVKEEVMLFILPAFYFQIALLHLWGKIWQKNVLYCG